MTLRNQIAKAVKEARKKKGWSQAELANIMQCSQTYIALIECNGKLGIDNLEKFAEVLDVKIIFEIGG